MSEWRARVRRVLARRHLFVSHTAWRSYMMTTSFGAFEIDIALPVELSAGASAGASVGASTYSSATGGGVHMRPRPRAHTGGVGAWRALYDRGFRNGWGNRPCVDAPKCVCLPVPRDWRGLHRQAHVARPTGQCAIGHVASCWPIVAESMMVVPIRPAAFGLFSRATATALASYVKGTGYAHAIRPLCTCASAPVCLCSSAPPSTRLSYVWQVHSTRRSERKPPVATAATDYALRCRARARPHRCGQMRMPGAIQRDDSLSRRPALAHHHPRRS